MKPLLTCPLLLLNFSSIEYVKTNTLTRHRGFAKYAPTHPHAHTHRQTLSSKCREIDMKHVQSARFEIGKGPVSPSSNARRQERQSEMVKRAHKCYILYVAWRQIRPLHDHANSHTFLSNVNYTWIHIGIYEGLTPEMMLGQFQFYHTVRLFANYCKPPTPASHTSIRLSPRTQQYQKFSKMVSKIILIYWAKSFFQHTSSKLKSVKLSVWPNEKWNCFILLTKEEVEDTFNCLIPSIKCKHG